MNLDWKQIQFEDMAERARQIVEEENADAHDNSASHSRVQQLKKLQIKPPIQEKKNLQNVKMKAFKKELEKLFI